MKIYKEGNRIIIDMKGDIILTTNPFSLEVDKDTIDDVTSKYGTFINLNGKFTFKGLLKYIKMLFTYEN